MSIKKLLCAIFIANMSLLHADDTSKKAAPTPKASTPPPAAPAPAPLPVITVPATGTPTKKPTDEQLSGTAISWLTHNPGKCYIETKIDIAVDLNQITKDTSASGVIKAGTGRTVEVNQTLNASTCLLIKDVKAALYNCLPTAHSWFPDPFLYHVIGVNGAPVVYSYNKDGNEVITTLK